MIDMTSRRIGYYDRHGDIMEYWIWWQAQQHHIVLDIMQHTCKHVGCWNSGTVSNSLLMFHWSRLKLLFVAPSVAPSSAIHSSAITTLCKNRNFGRVRVCVCVCIHMFIFYHLRLGPLICFYLAYPTKIMHAVGPANPMHLYLMALIIFSVNIP